MIWVRRNSEWVRLVGSVTLRLFWYKEHTFQRVLSYYSKKSHVSLLCSVMSCDWQTLYQFYTSLVLQILYESLATTGFFRGGGSEVHQRRACKRVAGGFPGGGAPGLRRSFQKIVKNQWKFYNFIKFSRKFRDFFKIHYIFIEFLAKICTKI